jgi:predicted Zn-dependent protease
LTSAASRKTGQKRGQGYCYVTNVLAGEHLRLAGKSCEAEEFFREITEREPDNPWGWYLLGDLFAETGKVGQAIKWYENTLKLVPQHAPSFSALRELKKRRDLKRPRPGNSA